MNGKTAAGGGYVLAEYLQGQATEFLRALRLHRSGGAGGAGSAESAGAARALRRAVRRIGGALHTFGPLLEPEWSDALSGELAWLAGTLGREHASAARLERLLAALHRLSGTSGLPGPSGTPGTSGLPGSSGTSGTSGTSGVLPPPRGGAAGGAVGGAPGGSAGGAAGGLAGGVAGGLAGGVAGGLAGGVAGGGSAAGGAVGGGGGGGGRGSADGGGGAGGGPASSGALTVGAAKAGALLERQLTLARTRAHSTALQALGSSRFHAVADRVAVLASEVPLAPNAVDVDLRPLADEAEARLAEAVAALPLRRAARPYNAEALTRGLATEPEPHPQDVPWHRVRLLLRLHRYACEVLLVQDEPVAAVPFGAAEAGGGSGGGGDGGGVREGGGPRLLAEAGFALDRHHEAAQAAAAAATAARTPRIAPATAYALGVLHADQRHEVEAARFAFQDIWLRMAVSTR